MINYNYFGFGISLRTVFCIFNIEKEQEKGKVSSDNDLMPTILCYPMEKQQEKSKVSSESEIVQTKLYYPIGIHKINTGLLRSGQSF